MKMPWIIAVAAVAVAGTGAAAGGKPAQCNAEFVRALEACRPAACTFAHPIMPDFTVTQRVTGREGGICRYEQTMPGGGRMTCGWDEAGRQAMADYLLAYLQADTHTQMHISSADGEAQAQVHTKERMDGQPVTSPLARALKDGTCHVSGYGN